MSNHIITAAIRQPSGLYSHERIKAVLRTMASTALAWFSRAARRMREREQERRDRLAFQAMPDHLLRDIGISRQEIDFASSRYARPGVR